MFCFKSTYSPCTVLPHYLIRSYNPDNLRTDEAWWRAKHISDAHDDACVLRRDIQDVDGITGSVQTCYADTDCEEGYSEGWAAGVTCDQDEYWSRCTTCERRKSR